MLSLAFGLIVVLLFFATAIKILREWERGVILRLGTFHAVRGPGITFVIPLIERMYRINTRVVTVDVPPQDVITKDNVTLTVNAVVFLRVLHPKEAVVTVEDFSAATSQKAQTVLRNVLGQSELDDLLAARDEIHLKLQAMLDAETDQWGMKVDAVAIKHVGLPQTMQRVNGRIEPLTCPCSGQHDGGGQMGKRGCRRWIGKVIRRNIHGLDRGDSATGCIANPFLFENSMLL